jgi:hypothetical protein
MAMTAEITTQITITICMPIQKRGIGGTPPLWWLGARGPATPWRCGAHLGLTRLRDAEHSPRPWRAL